MLGISIPDKLYILYIVKQYDVVDIFVFLSLNYKIWYKILINMHFFKQDPKNETSIPDVRSVNSNVILTQAVKKFVFLLQCLISSIWLKIHFSKPFFVLKKSLIFHVTFLPKVLLAAVFKNSGICEYYSMIKVKESLMSPFYWQN